MDGPGLTVDQHTITCSISTLGLWYLHEKMIRAFLLPLVQRFNVTKY